VYIYTINCDFELITAYTIPTALPTAFPENNASTLIQSSNNLGHVHGWFSALVGNCKRSTNCHGNIAKHSDIKPLKNVSLFNIAVLAAYQIAKSKGS